MQMEVNSEIVLACLLGAVVVLQLLLGFAWWRHQHQTRRWLEEQHSGQDLQRQHWHAHLNQGFQDFRQQVHESLLQHGQGLHQQLQQLHQVMHQRLQEISGQVEKRVSHGFEQTQQVFQDVLKRLTLIDTAQQRLQELSTHVVDLQRILSDKSTRGAWGEVQLKTLVCNAIPEKHVTFQATLSNGKRVDCLLHLPPPSHDLAIDAKFPLEYFQQLQESTPGTGDYKQAQSRFRQMVSQHIQAISEKYRIPGETAEGAVMFVPSEAIFAEIHTHFPDLVSEAQRLQVWMASPSTLLAILTTAAAMIRDVETRDQVLQIQTHLRHLHDDFLRFDKRMNQLARHIDQAHADVQQIHTSSQKISKRFAMIEKVELDTSHQEKEMLSIPSEEVE